MKKSMKITLILILIITLTMCGTALAFISQDEYKQSTQIGTARQSASNDVEVCPCAPSDDQKADVRAPDNSELSPQPTEPIENDDANDNQDGGHSSPNPSPEPSPNPSPEPSPNPSPEPSPTPPPEPSPIPSPKPPDGFLQNSELNMIYSGEEKVIDVTLGTTSENIAYEFTVCPDSGGELGPGGNPFRIGRYVLHVTYTNSSGGTNYVDTIIHITPAPLRVGLEFARKIYDRTTDVEIDRVWLEGVFGNDDVRINFTPTPALESYKAAENVAVLFENDFTIAGMDTANYYLLQPDDLTINIKPKGVIIELVGENREVNPDSYQVSGVNYTLHGVLSPDIDDVSTNFEAPVFGTADDWQAGVRTFEIHALKLTGSRAHNYYIADQSGTVTFYPLRGEINIEGNPWLRETLSYSRAEFTWGDGNQLEFTPENLANWYTWWWSNNNLIEGEADQTYIVTPCVVNTQIGLTLLSDCGNYLAIAPRTDNVPFDIHLAYNKNPVRRAGDNTELSGGIGGHGENTMFRRQVSGGNITVVTTLTDGGMKHDGTNVTGVSGIDLAVGSRNIHHRTTRDTQDVTYMIEPDDAVEGIITILATYTHRGVSVDTGDLDFGNQTCRQILGWRAVTITNIGNVETGTINLSLAGDHAAEFELQVTALESISGYNETKTFNIRPNPTNLANEADAEYQSNADATNRAINANVRITSSDLGNAIDRSMTATVIHAQSDFAASGDSCRTICTVADCGVVIRKHVRTTPAWTNGSGTDTHTREAHCSYAGGCYVAHDQETSHAGDLAPEFTGEFIVSGSEHARYRSVTCAVEDCDLNHNQPTREAHAATSNLSGWQGSESNCIRACSVENCGIVSQQHTTSWDNPVFAAGGNGCTRTISCTGQECTRTIEDTHETNLNNPAFTGADNAETCTRTRVCQASGCARQVVDSHTREGSQGGIWTASGTTNCRRASPCTVDGCGRANAWVEQHATQPSGWTEVSNTLCRRTCLVQGCGRETNRQNHNWTGWGARYNVLIHPVEGDNNFITGVWRFSSSGVSFNNPGMHRQVRGCKDCTRTEINYVNCASQWNFSLSAWEPHNESLERQTARCGVCRDFSFMPHTVAPVLWRFRRINNHSTVSGWQIGSSPLPVLPSSILLWGNEPYETNHSCITYDYDDSVSDCQIDSYQSPGVSDDDVSLWDDELYETNHSCVTYDYEDDYEDDYDNYDTACCTTLTTQ